MKIDSRYLRPSEVDHLSADSSKAKRLINWEPKIHAPELSKIMVDYDMQTLGLTPPNDSRNILKLNQLDWITEPPISSVFSGV